MRIQRFLIALALPLMLAGCAKDDSTDPVTGAGGEITFNIGFAGQNPATAQGAETRVATDALFNSTWDMGDAIGIFAVAHGQPLAASGNYIDNVLMIYNADTNTWSLDSGAELYWPQDGGRLDFYAYYPYSATIDPTSIAFTVHSDQRGNFHMMSYLLSAASDNSGSGYGATTTSVPLTFTHALAMVQVGIPVEGKGFGPSENLTVTLRGVKAKAVLDLGDADATPGSGVSLAGADNEPADITMYRVEQPGSPEYATTYTYRALVPAQSVAQGASLFMYEHEQRQLLRDGGLTAELTLTAGQAETFTRTLPATLLHTSAITAGTFQMGSPDSDTQAWDDEKPRHWVRLTQDFYMSRYEVTNAQYAAFLNANNIDGSSGSGTGNVAYDRDGSSTSGTQTLVHDCTTGGRNEWGVMWNTDKWEAMAGYEDHPVIYVTWYGAKAYADWIGGALPTEAQREYACRAGSETVYSYGDTADGDYMWDSSNCGNQTHKVGEKQPNAWGLYDMHGNVLEWCLDQWNYIDNYPTADTEGTAIPDPLVTTGSYRVLRGGSWLNNAAVCRSAYRFGRNPDDADANYGFRVVLPLVHP